MPTVHEVDEITDGMLGLLVKEPEFVKEWEQRTQEALDQEKKPLQDKEKLDEITVTFEELIRVVDLATQSFLDVEGNIYKITDSAINPDSSSIFSLDLQFQRLEDHPNVQRLLSSARRVNQLTKKFPSRLVNGCHVSNCLKLASCLCGTLFRLEEYLRTLKGSLDVQVTLARSASDFNRIVVAKLEEWKREIEDDKAKSKIRPVTPKTPQRRPLSQLQYRNPGGFLLSPEFVKARQSFTRSRSATPKQRTSRSSLSRASQHLLDPEHLEKRRKLADKMQNKWGNLLDIDQVLRKSLPPKGTRDSDDDSATTRIAKRISAQVLRDLRKSLGSNQPPLILTSSNHL